MTDDTDRPEPIQSIADAHRLNLSAMPRVEAALTAAFEAGRRTPAPVSGDMREVIKRAVLPIIDKVPAVDASQSRIREIRAGWMADAALTASPPTSPPR